MQIVFNTKRIINSLLAMGFTLAQTTQSSARVKAKTLPLESEANKLVWQVYSLV